MKLVYSLSVYSVGFELLISALTGILEGLRAIFEHVRDHFRRNLDRIAYITLCHGDFTSAIQIGPYNLSESSTDEIVQMCREKIDRVLESYANLSVNKTLEIYIRVLGKIMVN